jgi:hypothetical protein
MGFWLSHIALSFLQVTSLADKEQKRDQILSIFQQQKVEGHLYNNEER